MTKRNQYLAVAGGASLINLTPEGFAMKLIPTPVVILLSLGLASHSSAQTKSSSERDQLVIAVQKICPVSGKPLGSMGTPPKVKIGDEEIFLCCKGCAKGQIKKEHWITIHSNFAKAQGVCPVMEKKLPANPKWTFVNGQIVYICCPPCTKKIHAEPVKYLAKVDGYYRASLKASTKRNSSPKSPTVATSLPKPANRDQLKAAVQGICPVSGNRLDSTAKPIKVKADDLELYLCCEGCEEGEIKREHWATILNNIAKAQGSCPVMEKELPENAKSTVIEGQLVFVCCPPCTKKIEKEPAMFLGRIDSYYMASLKQQRAKASTTRR